MNGNQYVREYRTDYEVDMVAFDHAAYLLDRHIGLELIIRDDELHFLAAHFAAQVLQCEFKAVLRLLPERGSRARQSIN
jgi:hypothetical protein